jgi:hypothetical protein
MTKRRQRTVLLVDEIADHDGVMDNIRSSGRHFQSARLAEMTSWHDVTKMFDEYDVTAVLVKFSVTALIRVGTSNYRRQAEELVSKIAPVPHVVFMTQSVYTGEATRRAEEEAAFVFDRDSGVRVPDVMVGNTLMKPTDVPHLKKGIAFIKKSPLRVVVSRNDAEITVAAEQFIREAEKGLLFRAYVPSGQIWETEFDRMLTLFKDFLVRVANADVRLESNRTLYGVTYAFFGEGVTPQQAAANFEEFTTLLNVAVSDAPAAEAILSERYALERGEIAAIITRYAKEARRLHVDIRHERQRKFLSIRQQLESELSDVVPPLAMREIEGIVDLTLPQSLEVVPVGRRPVNLDLFDQPQSSFCFSEQQRRRLDEIVIREVQGTIELLPEEQHFLAVIDTRGGEDARDLTTSLYQLRDPGTPDAERVTTAQRLRTFLLSIGDQTQFKVLHGYIERRLGL